MKRLIIAIDCDDVLVQSTRYIVDEYNTRYGTSVQLESAHASGNPEWQEEREVVHRRINDIQLSEAYGQLAPESQVTKTVSKLAKNHELHLVTARAKEIESVTRQMIEEYFPACFTSIEHVGYDASKEVACSRVGAEILIDDNIKHLLSAQTAGVAGLLWFGHYPWQDRSAVPEGINVVADWAQVVEYMNRLSRG